MLLASMLMLALSGAPDSAPAEPELSPEYLEAYDKAEAEKAWVYDNYLADTKEAIERLRTTLTAIEAFEDDLAKDEYGRKLVIDLRKSLARTLLARGKKGDAEEAHALIDAVVRASTMESTDLFFGNEMEDLITEQTEALEAMGKATIEWECYQDCVVLIDRRPATGGEQQLYLGSYTVEIRAASGDEPPPVRETVVLSEKDERKSVVFGSPPEPEEPEPEPVVEPEPEPEPEPDPEPEPPKRMLPRWLEISGIVAGAGLVGAGGGMLSVDGQCRDLDDDINTCPKVWESTPGGVATIVIGAGLAITSAVLLGLDEKRTRSPEDRTLSLSPAGVVIRF